MIHRYKCKHFFYESCRKKSGYYGGMHLLMGCDGDCWRMKNYDKKVKMEKEKKNESQGTQGSARQDASR